MFRKALLTVLVGASVLTAACGDDSGPGGELDEEEQAALLVALAEAGVFTNFAAPLAFGAQFGQSPEIGEMGDFAAFGSQVLLTLDAPGTAEDETIVLSSITGWTNLDAGASTVDNAIFAGAIQTASSFPNTLVDELIGDGDAFGGYYERSTSSRYIANEGQFSLTSATFGSTEDCDNVPPETNGIEITACTFSTGTMNGNFDFSSQRVAGSGIQTFTQPNIAYSIPAVRLTITVQSDIALNLRGK
jgi:hypothetical protein